MRVAVISPGFFGEYVMGQAEGLSDIALCCLVTDSGFVDLVGEESAKRLALKVAIFQDSTQNLLSRIAWVFKALRFILNFQPTILHVHEHPDPYYSWFVRLASLLFPYVITVHDPEPHSGRDAEFRRRHRRRVLSMRSRAAALIAHGHYCHNELAATYGSRVHNIAHGPILRPRLEHLHPPINRSILMFGRMEAYKGLEVLLDALRLLQSRGTQLEALVAGRGPELERLKERLLSIPGVSVEDRFLPPSDAVALFQRAAIVVLPYLDATQSGVAAAAFANGRPVVATRVGAVSEVVCNGVNGFLIAPGSAEELANALEKLILLPEPQYQAMCRAAMAFCEENDWQKIAQKTLQVYKMSLIGVAI